jgi:4-hydroxy-tetrahydrodipicolinate reductase
MISNGGPTIKLILYGVGAIGSEVAKFALTRSGLKIVGAVDSDPAKIGTDLGSVLGLDRSLGIEVSGDPVSVFEKVDADVVLLTTGSFLPAIYDQLENIAQAGLDVVTSAEELAFPTLQSAELAEKLDGLAREKDITIKAAGVNPGFVMDSLIVFLATSSADIEHVSVRRIVDCSLRRKQLQLKVGAGVTVEQFKARLGKEFFGHAGLMESAAVVADALGVFPDRISQTVEPVIAQQMCQTAHVSVKRGNVSGMRQIARSFRGGNEYVKLEVLFYIGAPEPKDQILIKGKPDIDVTIKDGIAGDQATVAILINSILPTLEAKSGLLTPTGKSVADIKWRCPVDPGY